MPDGAGEGENRAMSKIFLVAFSDVATGGTELTHQLGHSLRKNGADVYAVYEPFDEAPRPPEAFARYGVPVASLSDIKPGDSVVVPEMRSMLIPTFKQQRVYFWWMSVDNFFIGGFRTRLQKLPKWLYAGLRMRMVRRRVHLHLYQSEYARQYIEEKGLGASRSLTDYLAQEYLDGIETAATATPREDILVFNPKKGAERTALIVAELERRGLGHIKPVPLINMNRDQVKDLLSRAKVYIDFGGHPGKDRIPREAAAKGACIITNRRGSAGNPIDVGIDDSYKIDDTKPGFAAEAVDRIVAIMNDFEGHAPRFDAYRAAIAAEPAQFEAEVRAVFGAPAAH